MKIDFVNSFVYLKIIKIINSKQRGKVGISLNVIFSQQMFLSIFFKTNEKAISKFKESRKPSETIVYVKCEFQWKQERQTFMWELTLYT